MKQEQLQLAVVHFKLLEGRLSEIPARAYRGSGVGRTSGNRARLFACRS